MKQFRVRYPTNVYEEWQIWNAKDLIELHRLLNSYSLKYIEIQECVPVDMESFQAQGKIDALTHALMSWQVTKSRIAAETVANDIVHFLKDYDGKNN